MFFKDHKGALTGFGQIVSQNGLNSTLLSYGCILAMVSYCANDEQRVLRLSKDREECGASYGQGPAHWLIGGRVLSMASCDTLRSEGQARGETAQAMCIAVGRKVVMKQN